MLHRGHGLPLSRICPAVECCYAESLRQPTKEAHSERGQHACSMIDFSRGAHTSTPSMAGHIFWGLDGQGMLSN